MALAVEARDSFWLQEANRVSRCKPLVAASVGPYGAYLADGSEYTGRYDLDVTGLREFHRRRWRILAATDADILACETIPSFAECRALAGLLLETPGRWAWFSFSCKDSRHVSDGSRLADCLSFLGDIERVAAVGVNCTSPVHVPGLLSEARAVTDKPLILYPNSGETFDAESKRWMGRTDADDFAQGCREWRTAGASVIGGCCRTGPEHIRQIRTQLLEDD